MPAADLQAWVGRREEVDGLLVPTQARALAATLDVVEPLGAGDVLPPLWHWVYLPTVVPSSGLGVDGHEARGGFLPPIELERRMWAGGRLRFVRDLHLGEAVQRRSWVEAVTPKQGSTGPLVFVQVRHDIVTDAGVAVEERQDLVYLPRPAVFRMPPPDPLPDVDWQHEVPVDEVLLFRFSALTFNAHRIHYDLSYARDVEHYPGLVVHGPLQAVLLAQSARRHRPGRRVATFGYRTSRPLLGSRPCTVAGAATPDGADELFTADPAGDVAMRALVTWDFSRRVSPRGR